MTAAERDAAIAALEGVGRELGALFLRLVEDGEITGYWLAECVDAVVRKLLYRQLAAPVERDELKDALLWHWAAIERLRRLGPYGVLFRDRKPEFHWATIMRDDAAERVRALLEVADGDDR